MEIGTFQRKDTYGIITPLNPGEALLKALQPWPKHKRGVWVRPDLVTPAMRNGGNVQFTWAAGDRGVIATSVSPMAIPATASAQTASSSPVNPYNFVRLFGKAPFGRSAPGETPTYDRFQPGLLSGVLNVALKAVTPVFVPDGNQEPTASPREPWKCLRPGGTKPAYGLPGSSVKGVLRAMYEAWTNGHLGPVREPLGAVVGVFGADRGRQLRIEDADPAEASFGFAADHKATEAAVLSHPFRGRVQPSTFWAAAGKEPVGPASLGPLVSPPDPNHGKRFYVTTAGAARGRKLYWHQKWPSGNLAPTEHLNVEQKKGRQFPPPLRPLPAETEFSGEVHFTNLEAYELGALIVSIAPGYFWETEATRRAGTRYGFKLGKAKPRGWGSLACKNLTVTLRKTRGAYETLDCDSLHPEAQDPKAVEGHVSALKEWLKARTEKDHVESLTFVRDLEHLLRLPASTVSKWVTSYPQQNTQTPDMPLATDVQVP